ncbi:MAG: hypothetical protein IPL33_14320 [Sphingobacteriales bacterium]|nr:hypothetical protein [Sphingobacteriales bacterium]
MTNNNCTATASQVVTVNTLPFADAGNDVSRCSNDSGVTIGTTTVAGMSYVWSPTSGLSSSTIAQPVASPAATTNYTVTVTNMATGCTATDVVLVSVTTHQRRLYQTTGLCAIRATFS